MSDLLISDKVSAIAKADIVELNDKIKSFNDGTADEEKFRSFRLARGVYGQRQEGVQMIRIKLPYGKFSADQLIRIADVADKYATEKMHCTTRQDIQIHYVKLVESPQLWSDLEDAGITLKEACGNTVRNVTATAKSGIDPDELFDVTPYAHAFFEYFLRNPICQDMGRKFKVSFSSSTKDSGFSFMHDLGFIPAIKDGKKGFEVKVGGGLGSQPAQAHFATDFLSVDDYIPFAEAVIRVFDRYGERASRGKARLKFLLKKIGFDEFMKLVEVEKKACINKVYKVDVDTYEQAINEVTSFEQVEPVDAEQYDKWLKTNAFEQNQKGFYGVYVKLQLGNIYNETARSLASLVKKGFAADDIRVTANQGFLLRFVPESALKALFNELQGLGLADPGFNSTADITACPGTDTCNLGIASSYGMAQELERLMNEEYPDLIYNNDIKIKISGCMNACGQHNMANIGFQGMSIKKGAIVMPAMQILLGGGFDKEGNPTFGDKVVKMPSKLAPNGFRAVLDDYDANALDGEYFNNYYQRQLAEDKMYFFALLKPFTKVEEVPDDYLLDWGTNEEYVKAIGVGECAGVVLDLVGTLIAEAEEKLEKGIESLENGRWQDSIYQAYNSFVIGAKAILTGEGVSCNTQISIINDFDVHFTEKGLISFSEGTFVNHVLRINSTEPSVEFAKEFVANAKTYVEALKALREDQIKREAVNA